MRLPLLFLLAALAPPLVAQPLDALRGAPVPVPVLRLHADSTGGVAFDALPLRSVEAAAALLPGVRRNFADGGLAVRARSGVPTDGSNSFLLGRRAGQAPIYVVDGVRLLGEPLVPFPAVAAVAVMTDFAPASYGDAAGGLVLVETRQGGDRLTAEVEALTSQGLDAFGHSVAAFSARGPLGDGRFGSFAFSGEWARLDDATPIAGETYRLSDEAFAALRANPQVLQLTNGAGGVAYVPFPWEEAQAALNAGETFDRAALLALIENDVPVGFSLATEQPISAADTFTEEDFERVRAKDDPLRQLAFDGHLDLNLSDALSLRLGGGYATRDTEDWSFYNALYNRDRFYRAERDDRRLYATFRQQVTDGASYTLQAEYQDAQMVQYPEGFSANVEDAFSYGDIDDDYNRLARRYFTLSGGEYLPQYTRDGEGLVGQQAAGFTFFWPGNPAPGGDEGVFFRQARETQFRFSGSGTTQLGVHRLSFGGEYEQQTHRRYALSGFALSRFYADGSVEVGEGYARYEDLPFFVFEPRVSYYGYDFRGLRETDGQDIEDFFTRDEDGNRVNPDLAPYRPSYYAGFVQDRVAWSSLTLDLGLRVEGFDANALGLIDRYATRPVVRARDLDDVPFGVGDDFAVYFNGRGEVVGYRDLDGNFYNTEGAPTTQTDVVDVRAGQVQIREDLPRSAAFAQTPSHVVWEPRVAVGFEVSEQGRLFAYYGRLVRRPPAALYTPFDAFFSLGALRERTQSPSAAPEVVDAFGLGGEARPLPALAASATVFYRRTRDLLVPRRLSAAVPSYDAYLNAGTLTEYGLDLAVASAREAGLSYRVSYTLAFARSNAIDPGATNTFVGPLLPEAPADFDIRHALDVAATFHVPDGVGPVVGRAPLLGGLSLGAVFTAESGRPYTALSGARNVVDTFTSPSQGGLNASRLPWLSLLDLRLDKAFRLGPGTLAAFVWVENVLDTRNVLAVYRATGRPDWDGFLDTAGGAFFLDNALDPASAAFNYTAFVGGPVNIGGPHTSSGPYFYGRPRQVRLGVRLGL